MKIIFAGTPEFASVALQALLRAGFEVPLVLTQPDRPAGRGMQMQASAVKLLAQHSGIALAQPRSLRLDGKYPEDAAAARQAIAAARADVMVVAAYGLILPPWVLDMPRQGCLNIHASLLPRWRGAAPIHRALEAGDTQTGITIMQMDAGLDTGDMLLTQAVAITPTDTTATLHDTLATLGGRLIVQALQQAGSGSLQRVAQPGEGITYAAKIEKREARIDWSQDAAQIERRVRAFDPFPGCTAQINGEMVKIWRSEIDSCLRPNSLGLGHVLSIDADGISVQAGSSALRITQVQRAGGKRISAAQLARSMALQEGMRFD